MKKTITILSIFLFLCVTNPLYSAIRVSAMSGNFYSTSTWVGGFYPAFGDDIVISAGHRVTLDAAASVRNITIEPGATLVNGAFNLTILTTAVENPVYTNNGVHNGPGNLIAYEYYDTEVAGAGVTNCNIEIVSYGLRVLSGCILTINGNVQHSTNASWAMNGKIFIDNSQGGTLTINGDIITTPLYYIGIQNGGTLIVNGDIYLYGGSEFQLGSNIENSGIFHISGNLLLGDNFGYAWNRNNGIITIGGNLLGGGAGVTYFLQDPNSLVKFGGSVFPSGNDGDLCVAGPSAEPNTVEYNGDSLQVIKAPSDGAVLGLGYTLNTYSNLAINNTGSAGVILNSDISVNGNLTLTDGLVTLGTSNLTLCEFATVSGTPSASNMVVATETGEMRKSFTSTGSFIFPVGDNDGVAAYSPVTLDFTSGIFTGAYAGIKLVNAAYPGVTGNFLNRYWTLSQSGITDFNCNATFRYTADDVTGAEAELSCTKVSPLPWTTYGMANTTDHCLTATGVMGFSCFTGMKSTTPTTINELTNIVIGNGVANCYDATQTLIVAGNGGTFTIQSGGSVTMIAGQNIIFLPGTTVDSGGYMLGTITTTGQYCNQAEASIVAVKMAEEASPLATAQSFFRVYPNPTAGTFTLDINGEPETGMTKVEIFSMRGDQVLNSELSGNGKHELSLSGKPVGIYVIRMISGSKTETVRIIKQ